MELLELVLAYLGAGAIAVAIVDAKYQSVLNDRELTTLFVGSWPFMLLGLAYSALRRRLRNRTVAP